MGERIEERPERLLTSREFDAEWEAATFADLPGSLSRIAEAPYRMPHGHRRSLRMAAGEIARLRAENERLREALEGIANDDGCGDFYCGVCECTPRGDARAALTPTEARDD
jgi:hypothetical protein